MSITSDRLLDIVKAFAEVEPLYYQDSDGSTCLYCDYTNSRHTQDCPWRDAREALGLEVPEPEPVEVKPSPYGMMIAQLWEPAVKRYLALRTFLPIETEEEIFKPGGLAKFYPVKEDE